MSGKNWKTIADKEYALLDKEEQASFADLREKVMHGEQPRRNASIIPTAKLNRPIKAGLVFA